MISYKKYLTKDIVNTLILNLTRLFTGPISLVLIPYYLTKEMQGYWYSFLSISALSILADLGFTIIITQFSAHEFAKLRFGESGYIEGNDTEYTKLASLLRFVFRWSSRIIMLAFPIIFAVGFYILSSEEVEFSWRFPWLLYTIGSGIKFFANIILSFFEGCNEISKVQKMRYMNSILFFFSNCVFLFFRFEIYALALTNFITSSILLVQIWVRFNKPLKQLLFDKIEIYNWNSELFRLLWKYSISWISGYLIFQLFTPLAFKNFGSIFAGKVGFTLTVVNVMFTISSIWIYVINPKLNMLVSQKNWKELDKLFARNLKLSIFTFLLGSVSFIVAYWFVYENYPKIADRFLDKINLSILLFVWFIQLIINSLAIYSRAHKEEPFVIPSLVVGVYIMITTVVAAFFLPKEYLFIGFYSSFIIAFPWFTSVYVKRKMMLHN